MAENKEEIKKDEIEVPIKWHIPDTIITRYASNMTVQILEYEFKLSFFEIKPEIRLDPNISPPSEVQAECVASVIISPAKFPKFIEAMQTQLAKYLAKKTV
ncbi:MAG: hypothetical protein MUP30_04725 [Deltaproteobacteria bacterium]|nr:hypothetical protein [Deltaproteobacteria bacterium]